MYIRLDFVLASVSTWYHPPTLELFLLCFIEEPLHLPSHSVLHCSGPIYTRYMNDSTYKFSILIRSPWRRTEPCSLVDHSNSLFENCGSIWSVRPRLWGPVLYEPGFSHTWSATRTWNVFFVFESSNLKQETKKL